MGDYDLKLINRVDTVKEVYNFHIVSTHNDKGCMGIGTAEISFRNGAIQNTMILLPEGMAIELGELKGAIAAIEDKILTSSKAFRVNPGVLEGPPSTSLSRDELDRMAAKPCPAPAAAPKPVESWPAPPAPSIPRVKPGPRAKTPLRGPSAEESLSRDTPRKDFTGL